MRPDLNQINEMLARGAHQISRKEFLEQSQYDPIVHNVLQQWHNGTCTLEQALQQMTLALLYQNARLQKDMYEMHVKDMSRTWHTDYGQLPSKPEGEK